MAIIDRQAEAALANVNAQIDAMAAKVDEAIAVLSEHASLSEERRMIEKAMNPYSTEDP